MLKTTLMEKKVSIQVFLIYLPYFPPFPHVTDRYTVLPDKTVSFQTSEEHDM